MSQSAAHHPSETTASAPDRPEFDELVRHGNLSASQRLASFIHACHGLKTLLGTEQNAWIHFAATIGVVALAVVLETTRLEWCALTVAIAMVWMAEAFNTALERLADEVSEEHRERIGWAKDLGAGAVLIASVAASAIGVLVFAPDLMRLVA